MMGGNFLRNSPGTLLQGLLHSVAVAFGLALGVVASTITTAVAQTLPGEGDACMPHPGGGNGNTCTANDLRISAEVISGPSSCQEGETFAVTFRALIGRGAVSSFAAAERYKLGFFVGENGGEAIDPAPGGTCTVSYLTPNTGTPNLISGVGPYRELSTTADLCGDIDANENTYHNITTTKMLCRDNDGDGRVDVSAAVTWGTNKTTSVCSSPSVLVSDFYPDQSSKCIAEANFGLDIPVERPPLLSVSKVAIPTVLAAPGGEVAYSVTVTNESVPQDTITLTGLIDDQFGVLNGVGNCAVNVDISPGAEYSCSFVQTVTGVAGGTHTNVVTATGEDEEGNISSSQDDATVRFIAGIPPESEIELAKVGYPSVVPEPGDMVEYTVTAFNAGDTTLVITDITDDKVGGSLQSVGTCSFPVTVPATGIYDCTYSQMVSGAPGDVVTNTATVSAYPAGDTSQTLSDTASFDVTILDINANLRVVKTALDSQIADPGNGNTTDVAYRVELINLSRVDSITVTSLVDIQQEGNNSPTPPVGVPTLPAAPGLTPSCAVPQTLTVSGVGRRYTCFFARSVSGDNVNDGDIVSNTVTAVGTDDDGEFVTDSDGAEVLITSTPTGSIEVIKTAEPTLITSSPTTVRFDVEVINTGNDAINLTSLTDRVEGGAVLDITDANDVLGTTCAVPQILAVNTNYTCSFQLAVSGDPGDAVTDIVTASGEDTNTNIVTSNDDAVVAIATPPLDIDMLKSATPNVAAYDEKVRFDIEVSNSSALAINIFELIDSEFGDLSGVGTCSVPVTIASAGTYTCSFEAIAKPGPLGLHVNTVTANGTPSGGGGPTVLPIVSDSDRAYVIVLPVSIADLRPVPLGFWMLFGTGIGMLIVLARRVRR